MIETELVVLGLLNEGAEYAYEVEQRIRERRLREWAAVGFSSIYLLLNKAEEKGLVRSQAGPGRRGPRTRRYHLTDQGRQGLCSALLERLSRPPVSPGIELVVMFSGVLPAREFREALLGYARQARELAQATRQRWEQIPDSPHKVYQDAIFDHAVSFLEAESAWAERTAARLHTPPDAP